MGDVPGVLKMKYQDKLMVSLHISGLKQTISTLFFSLSLKTPEFPESSGPVQPGTFL